MNYAYRSPEKSELRILVLFPAVVCQHLSVRLVIRQPAMLEIVEIIEGFGKRQVIQVAEVETQI